MDNIWDLEEAPEEVASELANTGKSEKVENPPTAPRMLPMISILMVKSGYFILQRLSPVDSETCEGKR